MTLRYEDYIQSDEWRERRDHYYENHARRCVACRGENDIDLHHVSYERLGAESDTDLLPLCRDCHDWVHTMRDEGPKGGEPYLLTLTTLRVIVLATSGVRWNRDTHSTYHARRHRGATIILPDVATVVRYLCDICGRHRELSEVEAGPGGVYVCRDQVGCWTVFLERSDNPEVTKVGAETLAREIVAGQLRPPPRRRRGALGGIEV